MAAIASVYTTIVDGVGNLKLGGVRCSAISAALGRHALLDARSAHSTAEPRILRADIVDTAIFAGEFRWLATAVRSASPSDTVPGGKLAVDTTDGVTVDEARVIALDIEASNGVVHTIDTVVLPNWEQQAILGDSRAGGRESFF